MISKEYKKSNLALELKPGKKRLGDTLHVSESPTIRPTTKFFPCDDTGITARSVARQ
jgi:predicted Zn-dependent protease